jgi:hypothetical protein
MDLNRSDLHYSQTFNPITMKDQKYTKRLELQDITLIGSAADGSSNAGHPSSFIPHPLLDSTRVIFNDH